jgi:hypothetical protein
MLYHQQLLEQAQALAMLDPRRPKQANLRRAVSSAYYAVFHMLVYSASWQAAGPRKSTLANTANNIVGRWFSHGTMAKTSQIFSGRGSPKLNALFKTNLGALVTQPLQDVANAFVDLQEQRHVADYDLAAAPFTRQGTLALVQRARQAFDDWQTASESDPMAPLYMTLLLAGEGVIPSR